MYNPHYIKKIKITSFILKGEKVQELRPLSSTTNKKNKTSTNARKLKKNNQVKNAKKTSHNKGRITRATVERRA